MLDPDTFLTELYVLIDDWNRSQEAPPVNRGPAPALSASEVMTLAIFSQWATFASERAFWRYATSHLRPLFPRLPSRPQFNRAVAHISTRLTALALALGQQAEEHPWLYEIMDGTGVPTRNVKRRGAGWLAGEAAIGQCTRLGWYEGVRLLLATTPTGVITGWGCGPANTNDRHLAETFLAARAVPHERLPSAGTTKVSDYLADRGFTGRDWERRWRQDYGATVICPPEENHRRQWTRDMRSWLARHRQIVETATERLLFTFRLDRERPHALAGFMARLAAKIALHNVCIRLNRLANRPPLAMADFIDW